MNQQLTQTERDAVRAARRVRIVPGCPDCGGKIAFLVIPMLPNFIYICLDQLQREDPVGYEIACRMAGMYSVGSEYWQG